MGIMAVADGLVNLCFSVMQNNPLKCGQKSVTCLQLQGLVVLPLPVGILIHIARNA